jgi:hypothetical protein
MGRKSSIDRLPKKVRSRIHGLMRDNRLTLDEIKETIREEFGVECEPARTPLWRERRKIERFAREARELETIADVWVKELKEQPTGKTGRAILEMLRSLAAHAVMNAREKLSTDPKEIWALARAFNVIEAGGKRNMETEEKLRAAAKAELLEEQGKRIDGAVQSGGLTAEQAATFRREFLLGKGA